MDGGVMWSEAILFRFDFGSGVEIKPGQKEALVDFVEGVEEGYGAEIRRRLGVFAGFGDHNDCRAFPTIGEVLKSSAAVED